MQDKQWHMLETGLDLRIDEFGRLQIATNTPTGHVYQVLSLRPSTAYALKAWLGGQDWDAIERVAAKNDPTAASEFAAVRAHDAGTGEGNTMQDKLIEKSTKTRHCPKCNGSDVILTTALNNDLNALSNCITSGAKNLTRPPMMRRACFDF